MVDKHNKSFFGKTTGMIFDSGPSSSSVIFLTFIKKKEDGSWEKPSKKEGKALLGRVVNCGSKELSRRRFS